MDFGPLHLYFCMTPFQKTNLRRLFCQFFRNLGNDPFSPDFLHRFVHFKLPIYCKGAKPEVITELFSTVCLKNFADSKTIQKD